MTTLNKFCINGIGHFLPPTILQSEHIENELGLEKDWIFNHLGVSERRRANGMTCTQMGVIALQEALEDANLKIQNIDYLIGASATFDHVIPNRSSLIKHEMEGTEELTFPCLDINTVCTSFISALHLATKLLATNEVNHIAIVSSEIASNGLNSNDKETYSLFGDGAAAIIVSRSNNGELLSHKQNTYSSHAKDTLIQGGGNAYHPKHHPYDEELYSFKMEGSSLLRSALQYLSPFLENLCNEANTSLDQIDCIVPHQASGNGLKLDNQVSSKKGSPVA